MKKFNLIVIITLLVTMLSTTVFAVQFSDLSKEHWAYEPIIEMANRGILNGYPNGTFLPDSSITRAEFAKILVLALELKADKKEIEFQDVSKDDWSYQYIQAAAKYLSAYRDDRNNLIYMPNNKAVREDIAVAIVIASGHENDNYSLKTLDKFSDKEEISTNLRKYVAIAVENGLMSGHANGSFEPKGYLTRAQVSKLMMNVEKSKDKVVINEEDNITPTEKEYFTDISFDSKTLKLDLGVDWDKYQFCDQKDKTYIYVPAQRYLEYQTEPVSQGKDPETGKTISNTYAYFNNNSKITLKIMLKENSKKYILMSINNPFYLSKFTDEAYTTNGKKYIEIVVNATNDLTKAEYQIDNGSWTEDKNAINGKKASFVIDVTKYAEGKSYKATVRLTDKYGNSAKMLDYFEILSSDVTIDDENKEFTENTEEKMDFVVNTEMSGSLPALTKGEFIYILKNWLPARYGESKINGMKKVDWLMKNVFTDETINAIIKYQNQYHVSAVFALAVATTEQNLGLSGTVIALKPNYNIFNIKGTLNGGVEYQGEGMWNKYSSYGDAFGGFDSLIAKEGPYFKSGRYTIMTIAPIYANEKWGNSVYKIVSDIMKYYMKNAETSLDDFILDNKNDELDKVTENDEVVENDKVVKNGEFAKVAEKCMNWLNTYKDSISYGAGVRVPPYKDDFGAPNSSQMDSSGYVSWVIYEYGKANGIDALEQIGRWSTTNFKALCDAILAGRDYQGLEKYFEIVATRADMPSGRIAEVADKLQAGDIILYTEASGHHIEILKETGSTKVYTCGSASGWGNPGAQSYTRRSDVTYIFRVKK